MILSFHDLGAENLSDHGGFPQMGILQIPNSWMVYFSENPMKNGMI